MAYNYVIGPNGQPIILGQVQMMPLMQVPGAPSQIPQMASAVPPQQQQPPQPQQPAPPKPPDYMSEEKLQDKGVCHQIKYTSFNTNYARNEIPKYI